VSAPDWFNVRWFGAKGDAMTDDTAALRAAVAALAPHSTLYFPDGTYVVKPDALGSAVTLGKPLTFVGNGAGSIIKVANTTGDYRSLFTTTTRLLRLTFRGLSFDQNAAGNTTANIVAGNAAHAQFVIDVDADNVLIEGCTFLYCGINAVATHHGSTSLHITQNRFHFARGASSTPYYDNSAIYSRSARTVATKNEFISASIAGVHALGCIEIHASTSIVTHNISDGYATLVNLAPTSGSASAAHIIAHNTARRANAAIQLWIIDATSGVTISNNVLDVRQTLWRRARFGGILAATGTSVLEDFNIINNVITFDEELTQRTITDPVSDIVEQQWVNAGIGLHTAGATYCRGRIAGNTISKAPFAAIQLGSDVLTTVVTDVDVEGNSTHNCGHYAWAGSTRHRTALALVQGKATRVQVVRNTLRETYDPILSRHQIRADQGTFVNCHEGHNRYLTVAATQAASARAFTAGWTNF
jgi:hypothetical protein